MKRKAVKKLMLAKETVRRMTATELGQVAGATAATCTCTNSNYVDCPPDETRSSCYLVCW